MSRVSTVTCKEKSDKMKYNKGTGFVFPLCLYDYNGYSCREYFVSQNKENLPISRNNLFSNSYFLQV